MGLKEDRRCWPCLWSKVPDKRLTNKARSPGIQLASRTGGGEVKEGAPPRSSYRHLGVAGLGNRATAGGLG